MWKWNAESGREEARTNDNTEFIATQNDYKQLKRKEITYVFL